MRVSPGQSRGDQAVPPCSESKLKRVLRVRGREDGNVLYESTL